MPSPPSPTEVIAPGTVGQRIGTTALTATTKDATITKGLRRPIRSDSNPDGTSATMMPSPRTAVVSGNSSFALSRPSPM